MYQKKFISFGKPSINKIEYNKVYSVLKSKWIGTGPFVEEFEKKFRLYKKSKFALSVNSCTAALHLSFLSIGLKKGDEVITTPMTFAASINSIILAGCKPKLVDIRFDTFNINENLIEKSISKKTKAILLVHFSGVPCNLKKIIQIANKYKLKIIEDCAHAIETKYENKHVGNFGETGCFSFYANKNITTGEGGMLVCKSKKVEQKVRMLRLHGMSKDAWKRYVQDSVPAHIPYQHYDVKYVGLKYNLTDIMASMGIVQLKKIEKMWKKRKKIHDLYAKELKNLPVLLQGTKDYNYKNAYHLFLIVLDKKRTSLNRDEFLQFLKKSKIGFGIHYRSITSMSIYKKMFKWTKKICPVGHYIGENTVSLPIYPDLTYLEQKYIIKKVKEFFKKENN